MASFDSEHGIEAWVDYLEAPIWVGSTSVKACHDCSTQLVIGQKGHCRLCGQIYCNACSTKKYLPSRFERKGKVGPVRVCHDCVRQVMTRRDNIYNQYSRLENRPEGDSFDIAIKILGTDTVISIVCGLGSNMTGADLQQKLVESRPEFISYTFSLNNSPIFNNHLAFIPIRNFAPIAYVTEHSAEQAFVDVSGNSGFSLSKPTTILEEVDHYVNQTETESAESQSPASHQQSNPENTTTQTSANTTRERLSSPRASQKADGRERNRSSRKGASTKADKASEKEKRSRKGIWVVANFDYHSQKAGRYLSFKKNERLRVTHRQSDLWWWAVAQDRQEKGWIPSNYVSVLPCQEDALREEEEARLNAAKSGSKKPKTPKEDM